MLAKVICHFTGGTELKSAYMDAKAFADARGIKAAVVFNGFTVDVCETFEKFESDYHEQIRIEKERRNPSSENGETFRDIMREMQGMGNYQSYSGDYLNRLSHRIENALERKIQEIRNYFINH